MIENSQLPLIPDTKNSDWAAVSLIAGIGGLTFLPFIGSIIAIIAGYVGRSDIRRSNGKLVGENMATWGLVLGWIGLIILLVSLCLIIIIPLITGVTICSNLPQWMNDFGLIY